MAGIAGGRQWRGDARQFGGDDRLWRGVVGRRAVVIDDLAAGERDDGGGFSTRWDHAPVPMMNLKFRVPNGPTATCSVSICTFAKDGRKWFVLQLLPLTMPPAPASTTPNNAAAAAPGTPAVENKVEQDAALALKQKLDCALQLARTVSLDFNNALTSILGHTSLLLSKAEPGHPWRHSLDGGGKIGVPGGGNRE